VKYLLDTNTCIRHLNQRSPQIIQKLASLDPIDIVVCSVVKAELFYGAARSQHPDKSRAKQERFLNQFISLPFDDDAASIYGSIRADLASKGTPIGPNDLMIAAIALANNLVLVTHNTREFSRVSNLNLEDWDVDVPDDPAQ